MDLSTFIPSYMARLRSANRWLFLFTSTFVRTAARITTPWMACCQNGETLMSGRALLRIPSRISAEDQAGHLPAAHGDADAAQHDRRDDAQLVPDRGVTLRGGELGDPEDAAEPCQDSHVT